ncbi:MAG: LamG domain-containing protein [Candidatus Omnitrophica bacterium]|nr:LamG domain-containing protein [Candidatus Omnitrophota bacterium]
MVKRLILLLCLTLSGPVLQARAELPSPVAHYTFDDGDAHEVTGSGREGRVHGAAPFRGIRGRSMSFDGQDDFISLGNLDIDSGEITMMAWMLAYSFRVHDARIISKSTSTAGNDHIFMLSTFDQHGARLRFRLKTDDGFPTKTYIAPLGHLYAGEWIHVAATYDGRHMRLFKDGVEVGKTSKTGRVAMDPRIPVWIGRNPDGRRPFHGLIDDVRIYDRALSAQQIRAIIEEGNQ